jgi:hypothetical protein
MDTDKKAEEVDANGANGREFGHKKRKERKMKDLHAGGPVEAKLGALSKNKGFWRCFTPNVP